MKQVYIFAATLGLAIPLAAQDKSVRPGINQQFENPQAAEFINRFEREGRDAFDHREAIVQAVGLKPGMIVADIGAGTGLFTRLFAKEVGPAGKIYAVDIAENFVRHVERQAREAGLANVQGIVCRPDSVNLPTNSIDMAFICDAYHHFEFPQKTMRSIHAALKPGGQVILIDFHRIAGKSTEWTMSHVHAGQEVFCQEIADAEFKQIDERQDLLKESYFVRFGKIEK